AGRGGRNGDSAGDGAGGRVGDGGVGGVDDDERSWLILAGTGIVIFLSTPQWWVPHRDDLELGWGPLEHLVGNAYLIWGLAFLVVVGLRAARLGRPDLGGDPERPALFVRTPR
ncbi:hypothetical protein, partial [Acinetobacter baumannii]|uniref:hypothetical protein n=1 Tax=Acinetobacter baumannii TaxID=470 RepID=UPI0018E07548